jgi:hypothetical protein
MLLHHPCKGSPLDGQAARGSGALDSLVDISLEMHTFKRASDADRRRIVYGYSRHERTPRNHVIELNAEGPTTTRSGCWPTWSTRTSGSACG